ncbi:MAG TPA: OsmC family protein [Terriglobales bacterium]|nr:OsmC family protein [Terriglobales bacterium]
MPATTVQIRNVRGTSLAIGAAGNRTVTIDRAISAGGMGLGFNGGELLLLALGACFSNDVFREAAKLGITVHDVHVEVSADWGGEPVIAQNINMSVEVEADAEDEVIRNLIEHTNRVAEIPNTLRLSAPVKLHLATKRAQKE